MLSHFPPGPILLHPYATLLLEMRTVLCCICTQDSADPLHKLLTNGVPAVSDIALPDRLATTWPEKTESATQNGSPPPKSLDEDYKLFLFADESSSSGLTDPVVGNSPSTASGLVASSTDVAQTQRVLTSVQSCVTLLSCATLYVPHAMWVWPTYC